WLRPCRGLATLSSLLPALLRDWRGGFFFGGLRGGPRGRAPAGFFRGPSRPVRRPGAPGGGGGRGAGRGGGGRRGRARAAPPWAPPRRGPVSPRPPGPHPGWEGVRNGSRPGPSAPQGPSRLQTIMSPREPDWDEGSCLNLNVWTPAAAQAESTPPRPVLV